MAKSAQLVAAPNSNDSDAKVEVKSDFDLDAIAREVEGEEDLGKPFTFTYSGKQWTMRPPGEADARILAKTDLTDTQQVMAYIADLLGDQWADFPRITLNTALKLIDAFMEFTNGTDSGESQA